MVKAWPPPKAYASVQVLEDLSPCRNVGYAAGRPGGASSVN